MYCVSCIAHANVVVGGGISKFDLALLLHQ